MQWILWTREMCLHNRTQDSRRHDRAKNRARGVRRIPRVRIVVHGGVKQLEILWWRCAYGTHPFPSRTRRLRHKRPMVLCWRRYGRAGGCQIHGGIAQLGEHLPCKQGVKGSNPFISTASQRIGIQRIMRKWDLPYRMGL